MAPYDEPAADRSARIKRIGVPLCQEDLWKEVIHLKSSNDRQRAVATEQDIALCRNR